jgi:hypothetical protein
MIRSLLVVFSAAFGCSLLTSLDFVGNPSSNPDAGRGVPEVPDANGADADVDVSDASLECADPCSSGKLCVDGNCVCPEDTLECDGSCVTSLELEDAGYCGACGTKCRDDQNCSDAGCVCTRGGTTDCGSACADLSSDPDHCGACGKACRPEQLCIQGTCKSSPCDDLCTNPEVLHGDASGFRKDPLGTGASCFAVKGYEPTKTIPKIVCWNFDSERTLTVNGQRVPCMKDPGYALTVQPDAWYCVQVSAGGADYAGFVFPME